MPKYPPSTIYRYLGLPSTQRIQSHTHHHRNPNTDTRPTGLVKPNPILFPLTPHLLHHHEPKTFIFHTLHQLLSSHAAHSSLARQLRLAQYLNHVYHPHTHALHSPQPHFAITIAPSHSQHTHIQHKQQYTHHSHRIHIGTKTTSQIDQGRPHYYTKAHRPSSKSDKNLIILQVNKNGNLSLYFRSIKTELNTNLKSLNGLFTTYMQISSQFMKPTPIAKKTPKVHNFTTVYTDWLHQAWSGLLLLSTYSHDHC